MTAKSSPFSASDGSRPHTHALGFGDVNADGNLDAVTANNNPDDNVSVLLGDGKGAFNPAAGSPFPVGNSPYPLALGDLNGDQKIDIVTPNSGASNLTVLWGDGKGKFLPAPLSPFEVGQAPYYAAVGDLNHDQKLDVVVAHNRDEQHVSVLLNDGKGGFKSAPASPLTLGSRAWGIVIADANQDGNADILAATNTTVSVLLGNGKGLFKPAAGSSYPAGRGTWRLAVADLNKDGKVDIATSNLESSTVTVLLGK